MMTPEEQNHIIDLWMQFISGNEEAFSQMYCLFFDDLWRYGCRVGGDKAMVEDLIQDLFLKIYQKKIFLTDERKLRPFMFRALKNMIYNQLVRDARLQFLPDDRLPFDLQYTIDEYSLSIYDRDLSDEIRDILNGLTDRQKEIIYLRFIHEMSFDEIAEIMDINVQSARNLLTRSLSKIRKDVVIVFF